MAYGSSDMHNPPTISQPDTANHTIVQIDKHSSKSLREMQSLSPQKLFALNETSRQKSTKH